MKALIIIGYYKKNSFCHLGIKETILHELRTRDYEVIDLYEDGFNPSYQEENKELITKYQQLIREATHIFLITPVWWFRCTSMMEGFFDQVLTPNFAYKFKQLTKTYGLPVPLLKQQKVYCYMTHGAPALPVLTIYLNSVKMRLLLGVFSFCFRLRNCTIRQFFSVPFVTDEKRRRMLSTVQRDVWKCIDIADSYSGFPQQPQQ